MVAESTVHAYARPASGSPMITAFPRRGAKTAVPFIGFAEVYVLATFRRAGVPAQRIRSAVRRSRTIGLEPALASERLYPDATAEPQLGRLSISRHPLAAYALGRRSPA